MWTIFALLPVIGHVTWRMRSDRVRFSVVIVYVAIVYAKLHRSAVCVKLHLRGVRTDKHAQQQRPPRSPPSHRVDVAATRRRPCQDTNGRTNERTDAGNRMWCTLALKCDIWWQ